MLPLQSSYYTNKLSIADGTFYHYRHNNDSITKSKKNERIMQSFLAYHKMVFQFISSVELSMNDYSLVAMRFFGDCIPFILELDESLQEKFYAGFKNDIFSLVIENKLNDSELYTKVAKILATDDLSLYIRFVKQLHNKRMFSLIRESYMSKDKNA